MVQVKFSYNHIDLFQVNIWGMLDDSKVKNDSPLLMHLSVIIYIYIYIYIKREREREHGVVLCFQEQFSRCFFIKYILKK